jgi:hypothetical protein
MKPSKMVPEVRSAWVEFSASDITREELWMRMAKRLAKEKAKGSGEGGGEGVSPEWH